jgi:Protein of unknown function (DUF3592)
MSNNVGIPIALLCGAGLILIFAGIGAYLIYQSARIRKQAGVSQIWPSTEGKITNASLTHSTTSDSDGAVINSYTPRVEYSYQVAGQTYTGQNISFGFNPSFNSQQKGQSVLARYPVGGRVAVYYDPTSPNEAVLERKSTGANTSLVLGIIFLIVGLCLACPVIFILLTGVFSTVTRGSP